MQVSKKCLSNQILYETSRFLFSSLRGREIDPKLYSNAQAYSSTAESFNSSQSKTYFLKGLDNRILTSSQREDLISYVNSDPKGQSFLVYNSHEALRKLKDWQQKLPWIKPYYALKSNPIVPLILDLTSNGAGLDVASKGEILKGLQMGVPASSMIYSNPVKEEKDILYAMKQGVNYTTADSIEELIKIKQLAPKMKVLWRISIVEDNSKQLSTTFSGKFGDDFSSLDDAHARFKYIARDLGISLYGIHFHCGSGKNGSTSFLKAVSLARKCIKIGRMYGHSMEILDLGGGYPSGDLQESFTDALKSTHNDPLGYKVIAEPGRHFSSHSCYLFTRVLAKRTKQNKTCFHLNDSLYHSFNCVLMDGVSFENDNSQFYQEVNNETLEQQPIDPSSIIQGSLFGMTCDGMDVIAKSTGLPSELKVGDWLCFGGMGSYTYGPKSAFNGMESTTRVFEWDSPIGVPEKVFTEEKATESEEQEQPSLIWEPRLIPKVAF